MKLDWKTYFKDKKITLMGLGVLGRGINVAKFLLEHGALLTITDLKTEEALKNSLAELKPYEKQVTYVLGQHRLEDFNDKNFIVKAAGVPLGSPYIDEAHKNKVPVEMDASLFAKLMPKGVTLVGITGTKGKSTTTHLIHYILEKAGKTVYLGGNIRGLATLPLLEKVKDGDYVVLELDSWQLQGFGEAKISPHIAVFTNLMSDHQNYYKGDMNRYFADKANIYLHQKLGDFLIAGDSLKEKVEKRASFVGADDLPKDWVLLIPGEHNRANAALAMTAAQALKIPDKIIKNAIETFPGVEGRLQYVGEKNGIKVYNDNNSTTPDATLVGLRALAKNKNIVLIIGGADKNLDMGKLISAIPDFCHDVILLSGTGTEKIKDKVVGIEVEKLEDAFALAIKKAKKGDIILFSPAYASFSKYFQNEYERNDLFMEIANKWLKK